MLCSTGIMECVASLVETDGDTQNQIGEIELCRGNILFHVLFPKKE